MCSSPLLPLHLRMIPSFYPIAQPFFVMGLPSAHPIPTSCLALTFRVGMRITHPYSPLPPSRPTPPPLPHPPMPWTWPPTLQALWSLCPARGNPQTILSLKSLATAAPRLSTRELVQDGLAAEASIMIVALQFGHCPFTLAVFGDRATHATSLGRIIILGWGEAS